MQDQYGRKITYMRISVTDRCNLRCRYCMPEDIERLPREDLLTFDELVCVAELAAKHGIRAVKLTGGEPLVRRNIWELVAALKAVDGIEQVTMTTNGVLFSEYADALLDAGLDAVNISLDTLRPDCFLQITGSDAWEAAWNGLQAALRKNIPVKINCVLQSQINQDEWKDLAELARNLPVAVRFIEMMPIGAGADYEAVSEAWLREQLSEVFGELTPVKVAGNGPAAYVKPAGFVGSIGFISALHGPFCTHCNRLRLTSIGELKPCLCYRERIPLRGALRAGDLAQVEGRIVQAIRQKPKGHCFSDRAAVTEQRQMAQIGG